jgi:1,4-dihydroxy-2-naphthoate octaprenyltransferase
MKTLAEPLPETFPNPLVRYFAATRPAFLSATFVACLLGIAAASNGGTQINASLFWATMILALVAHAAANVLNDYFDALNGNDALNSERLFPFTGGSRFIQNGVLTLRETALFGYALMLVSILGGLWLMQRTSSGLMAIGAAGLFIGWAYSAEPLRMNSRGLGELCVLLGFTGVVAGADFVQRQAFSTEPWLIGLPYGLLVTNLLYINQFPDRKADAATGKHHWVVRLPLKTASLVYPALALLAGCGLLLDIAFERLPMAALIALLPLILSFKAATILYRNAHRPAHLLPAIRLTIAAMLSHGALLAAVLLREAP